MNVDPSKVNLAEKDIEDWLWANPGKLRIYHYKLEGWIGRQVRVPSGIIDLLGYTRSGNMLWPVVIELKNTEFTQAAILQACRYAADIEEMTSDIPIPDGLEWGNGTMKIVIAKGGPSNQLLAEAHAVNVILKSFDVTFDLSISGEWSWSKEYYAERRESLGVISRSDTFYRLMMLEPMAEKEESAKPEPNAPPEFEEFIDHLSLDTNEDGEK